MDPTDETGQSTATAEPDAPGTAAAESFDPSPEVGQTDPGNGLVEDFRLEDVPEEYRPHVEALEKQFKSAYTRARQGDSETLESAKEALALQEALEDPERALDLINEIAERHGFEASAEEGEESELGDETSLPPEVAERLAQVDELRQAEEARRHEQRVELVRTHVEEGIEKAFEGKANEDQRELVTWAAIANPDVDGLPNVDRAVELVEAIEKAAVKRFVEAKTGQPGAPDASGTTGVSQVDTSTEKGRLDAAAAIVARHLGSS